MLRINEITVTTARKVSDGNYGSKDTFIALKGELTEGTIKEAENSFKILKATVEEMMDEWLEGGEE